MKIRSKVMMIANKLVGKGYSRSVAMLKAWIIAKAERLSVRITGTSFNSRQHTLKAIEGKPDTIKLVHESENPADKNAISVWAFAEGTRGYYRIGYLPKAVAYVLAPLMDKGNNFTLDTLKVTGGCREGFSYGARLNIAI